MDGTLIFFSFVFLIFFSTHPKVIIIYHDFFTYCSGDFCVQQTRSKNVTNRNEFLEIQHLSRQKKSQDVRKNYHFIRGFRKKLKFPYKMTIFPRILENIFSRLKNVLFSKIHTRFQKMWMF